jgi:hypothetical protein
MFRLLCFCVIYRFCLQNKFLKFKGLLVLLLKYNSFCGSVDYVLSVNYSKSP